jgi:hypothetical protein
VRLWRVRLEVGPHELDAWAGIFGALLHLDPWCDSALHPRVIEVTVSATTAEEATGYVEHRIERAGVSAAPIWGISAVPSNRERRSLFGPAA